MERSTSNAFGGEFQTLATGWIDCAMPAGCSSFAPATLGHGSRAEGRISKRRFLATGPSPPIQRRDRVRALLLRAANVSTGRRNVSGRGKERFFGIMFQVHLELHGIRREMLEVRFELGDFFLKFLLQLSVRTHAFRSRESISVS